MQPSFGPGGRVFFPEFQSAGRGLKTVLVSVRHNRTDRRELFFFFNDTATTEIYTLSLHDALPISLTNRPDYGQIRGLHSQAWTSNAGSNRCSRYSSPSPTTHHWHRARPAHSVARFRAMLLRSAFVRRFPAALLHIIGRFPTQGRSHPPAIASSSHRQPQRRPRDHFRR